MIRLFNNPHSSISVSTTLVAMALSVLIFGTPAGVSAQQAPEVGYVFPPGAAAGRTVDVVLGGYDWTPDMQFFVHDKRVKFQIVGELGPMKVPPPPYWFGPRARGSAWPIPRQITARLTIPADLGGKVIYWQAANATLRPIRANLFLMISFLTPNLA